MRKALLNAFTVDVEDYFQVSAFDGVLSREDWASQPLRVEDSTRRLMDLLDEFEVRAIGKANEDGATKAKADEIYNALGKQGPQTSSDGRTFDFFEILTHVDFDSVDEGGHFEYAFTVRTQVRE